MHGVKPKSGMARPLRHDRFALCRAPRRKTPSAGGAFSSLEICSVLSRIVDVPALELRGLGRHCSTRATTGGDNVAFSLGFFAGIIATTATMELVVRGSEHDPI